MPLLPGLEDTVAQLAAMGAPPDELSTAEKREWLHEKISTYFVALAEERPPVASEVDHAVAVDGGEVMARVYRPDAPGPLPGYFFVHGGGFWLGNLDQSRFTCRGIATDVGCVVIDVDYRLAPEHKFPTAPEDCYAGLLWFVDHAEELGVDATRLAIGGESAGGNLAAVVAMMARDRGGPKFALQVLEIGVFDFTRRGDQSVAEMYLSRPEDAKNPYASPLLAPDLSGLPPAVVMSAEFDELSKEDAEYAQRLRDAGIPVEERCWEGQIHGSQLLAKVIPDEAAEYHHQIVAALQRAFGTA